MGWEGRKTYIKIQYRRREGGWGGGLFCRGKSKVPRLNGWGGWEEEGGLP